MNTSLSAFLSLVLVFPTTVSALQLQYVPVTTSSSSAPTRVTSSSSGPQEGSVDVFLEVEGLDGESTENSGIEPDEIDLKNTDGEPSRGVEPDEIDASTRQNASASASSKAPSKGGNVEFEWKVEEGESTPGVEPDEIDAQADPQEASVDYFLKIEGVEGESTENAGVEPDEIDVVADGEPLMTNFGILLGGDEGGDDGEELTEEQLATVAGILLEGMQEEGAPAETLSLNYEKIKTTTKKEVRLFGFIPVSVDASVEIDQQNDVKVKFPWWAFLATGKDADALGEQIVTSLSNVLKTKHDTVKNAIGNIR